MYGSPFTPVTTPPGSDPLVNGAENGLSVENEKVVLGGPELTPATLLDDRRIDLSGFSLGFTDAAGISGIEIFYGPSPAVLVYSLDPAMGASFQAANDVGSTLEMGVMSSTDPERPNVSYLASNAGATGELQISSGLHESDAFMSFYTTGDERMRLHQDGSLLLGRTTSIGSAFRLQLGDGNSDTKAFFSSSNSYAIAVRKGPNFTAYIGGDDDGGVMFSDVNGNEIGRVLGTGGFTAPGADGYGFYGAAGAAQGMFASGTSTAIVAGNAGSIYFGSNANASDFGIFHSADLTFEAKGQIQTEAPAGIIQAGAAKWRIGKLNTATAVTTVPNHSVEIEIDGVPVLLQVCAP